MQSLFIRVSVLLFSLFTLVTADTIPQHWKLFIGSAFLENRSYDLLQKICDRAGGRLAGSPENDKALNILKKELMEVGCDVRFEPFSMPGWFRGEDRLTVVEPRKHVLRSTALGYVQKRPVTEVPLTFVGNGFPEEFEKADCRDKLVLITSQKPASKREAPYRFEVIETAGKHGAKGVLFINRKSGERLLAGTGSFTGEPTVVPAFSVTYEEGRWLQRLCESGVQPTVKMETQSYCREIRSKNVVVTLPGKTKEKIVVGAHIDSWDLGQGAIDNGIGSAVLFETARLFHRYKPSNRYTIEFVWFNAEELGLWGSKRYVEQHKNEPIAAMLNMDMTGSPRGFNVMGFESYKKSIEGLVKKLNAFELDRGVVNHPWVNSDHSPFMLAGIPSFTPLAHLEKEMVKHYHSLGDSFDKVSQKYLAETSAVVSIFISYMANNPQIDFERRSVEQTEQMLKKHGLKDQLKRQSAWPFE